MSRNNRLQRDALRKHLAKRQKAKQSRRPPPPSSILGDGDEDAIHAIAEVSPIVVFLENEGVPVLRPRPDYRTPPDEDGCAFDRRICAAGLKHFVRSAFAGEWPVSPPPKWVSVQEAAPGIRQRLVVNAPNVFFCSEGVNDG
jgi:hypothetical protein